MLECISPRCAHTESALHSNNQYKGIAIGEYRADMVAERKVIIELKAVSALVTIHEVQLVNYLTATGIDHGLLINFGADVIEIRRKYRKYRKPF